MFAVRQRVHARVCFPFAEHAQHHPALKLVQREAKRGRARGERWVGEERGALGVHALDRRARPREGVEVSAHERDARGVAVGHVGHHEHPRVVAQRAEGLREVVLYRVLDEVKFTPNQKLFGTAN